MSNEPTPAPKPQEIAKSIVNKVLTNPTVQHALTAFISALMTAIAMALTGAVGMMLNPNDQQAPNVQPDKTPDKEKSDDSVIVVGAGAPEINGTIGAKIVYTGWVNDPTAVAAVSEKLKFKVFSDTPAGQVEDLPKQVFTWKAYQKLFARPPPAKDQGPVGSCTGFGTTTAIERTMANAIAFGGKNFEFKFISPEVIYAGSRIEIGKGRIGRGDGSTNAWCAKFAHDYGVVSQEKHGSYDLTSYDPARARSWGKTGVPNDLEGIAKEHPVEDYTQCENWSDCKKALAQGYGVSVASDQGFSKRRNSKGVAAPQGNWNHSMCVDGYYIDESGKEYGHIENSWGDEYFTGPVGWGDPSNAGFWAESKVIDRMLHQGDSWIFSAVKGFPAKQIKWDVLNQPKREPFKFHWLFADENIVH